jgi:hypothetical protein
MKLTFLYLIGATIFWLFNIPVNVSDDVVMLTFFLCMFVDHIEDNIKNSKEEILKVVNENKEQLKIIKDELKKLQEHQLSSLTFHSKSEKKRIVNNYLTVTEQKNITPST